MIITKMLKVAENDISALYQTLSSKKWEYAGRLSLNSKHNNHNLFPTNRYETTRTLASSYTRVHECGKSGTRISCCCVQTGHKKCTYIYAHIYSKRKAAARRALLAGDTSILKAPLWVPGNGSPGVLRLGNGTRTR